MMERPFHYGNAYEQQIASMLSTINANVYAQNTMLGGYIESTDKKMEELKRNKKRKRISDNICVQQDGTIILLEVYDNGEKIGSVNVISSENIEKADFLTQIKKVLGRLLK